MANIHHLEAISKCHRATEQNRGKVPIIHFIPPIFFVIVAKFVEYVGFHVANYTWHCIELVRPKYDYTFRHGPQPSCVFYDIFLKPLKAAGVPAGGA